MANDLSASKRKFWSRRLQRVFHKMDVYRDIGNFAESENIAKGVTVSRPYKSETIVRTLGSDGSYLTQDINDTEETLTIDQEKYAAFYIKDLDRLQVGYDVINEYAYDQGKKLHNKIDSRFLRETLNAPAAQVVDDGDLGGVAGNGIQLSTTNGYNVLSIAGVLMDENNIDSDDRVAVLSPRFVQTLKRELSARATDMGDEQLRRGRVMDVDDLTIYKSNNLTWTGELTFATNPTATDTVTINTVVFTFVAAVGATPGNVLIGGNAAASRANLVAAINGAAGAGTTYIEVSSANRNKLADIAATDVVANTKITIIAEGRSLVRVSETLTAGGDVWTPAKQIVHNLVTRRGSIDIAVQKYPTLFINPVTGKIGKDVVTWCAFGVKTFSEGLLQLVDIQIRTDAF